MISVLPRLRPSLSRRHFLPAGSYFFSSPQQRNTYKTAHSNLNPLEKRLKSRFRGQYTASQFSTSHFLGSSPARAAIMSEQSSEVQTKEFRRLPTTVTPSHYSLTLKPNLSDFTFEGSQDIKLTISKESSEIKLNSADLEVNEVVWEDGSGKRVKPTSVVLDEEQEVATFSFEPSLQPGSGTLKMSFTGTLNDKMKGFYRSKYKGPSGEERFNAVTQFEATDARRCFPCWDEPAIKATFDVTLVAPKDRVALSNMPIRSTTSHPTDSNLLIHVYDTTPVMSTYLIAFVVGEFDYIEAKSAEGVLCRVYTPVGKKEQGKFALDIAVRVLTYYKDYFGIAYPLPKMDLIAIADFSSGAMENWGLITYRETALLVQENESSAVTRQWVAIVVGHEIAHQWFGNLVTMEWWTHLWLNEGYASFVEYMCVDHLLPEYDIWTQFVTDTHIRALELDCLKNSHPIEVPVKHPSEIDEIFDDISYSKGASIIRMLHRFIGDEDFKKGMNLYLTRHQYQNTFTEDLWSALSEASAKPVGDVMTTWTKQMGYPLIKVDDVKLVGNDQVLSLTQEKFWADPSLQNDKSNEDYLWMVPLSFTTSKNPTKSVHDTLMDKRSLSVTISDAGTAQWVKINPGTVGFYRVQYPPQILANFVPAIQSKEMVPLDRLGLLDDVFALVQSGLASTVDVLKLLPAYVNEDNYTVFASISSILGKLNLLMAYSSSHDEFKAFGRSIFAQIEEAVGWEAKPNENHLQAMLRSLVLNRLGSFDDVKIKKEALRRFQLHAEGKQSVPADLRSAVYKGAISIGGEEVYDSLMKLYREAENQEEKDRIARALGSAKKPELLKKVLDFSISDEVRNQDTVFVVIAVGMTKEGRELAWNFFKDNWKLFADRYPSGSHVARILKYVTENFVTEEKALEVETFFRDHSFPGTERTVQQSVESIRLNEAWLKRDLGTIQNHLSSLNLNLAA